MIQSLAGNPLEVKTEAAHEMVIRLAREEGLFVGISSGRQSSPRFKSHVSWMKAWS
jgi:cysteine synthase